MYAAKPVHGTGVVTETVDGNVIISLEDEDPALLMGWTLRSATVTEKNLSATQKTSLSELFQERHISKAVRSAKHGLLQYLEKDDLLTPLQIAGFFLA